MCADGRHCYTTIGFAERCVYYLCDACMVPNCPSEIIPNYPDCPTIHCSTVKPSKLKGILGGIFGFLAFLAILVGMYFLFRYRRRQGYRQPEEEQESQENDPPQQAAANQPDEQNERASNTSRSSANPEHATPQLRFGTRFQFIHAWLARNLRRQATEQRRPLDDTHEDGMRMVDLSSSPIFRHREAPPLSLPGRRSAGREVPARDHNHQMSRSCQIASSHQVPSNHQVSSSYQA